MCGVEQAVQDAFGNWKATYNLSLFMSYGSSFPPLLLSLRSNADDRLPMSSLVLRPRLEMLQHPRGLDRRDSTRSPYAWSGAFSIPFSSALTQIGISLITRSITHSSSSPSISGPLNPPTKSSAPSVGSTVRPSPSLSPPPLTHAPHK